MKYVDPYTNCSFLKQGKNIIIDLNSCVIKPPKINKLTNDNKPQADHLFPAKLFWQKLSCGKDLNPREACLSDRKFVLPYTDLHNLYYTQAQLNNDKSDLPWCDTKKGLDYGYGFKIDRTQIVITSYGKVKGCVSPPDNFKGDVARLSFYLVEKYKIEFTSKELEMFKVWDKLDPKDKKETERFNMINLIQR